MAYESYIRWKTTPLEERPYLSIVIPAYNEAERIVPTIGAISSYVSELGFPWELIIADDGSRDETVELVESLGFANLRLLRAEANGGKGRAVQRGMLAARGQYILFDDADNSTPIEELDKLLRQVREGGYDVVVGSRAADGAEEAHRSAFRRLLSNGLRWIVRNIFRMYLRNTWGRVQEVAQEALRLSSSARWVMRSASDGSWLRPESRSSMYW